MTDYHSFVKILTNQKEIYLCSCLNFEFLNLFIVTYDNNEKRSDSIYSKRVRAGKRRTYFFDVRSTKGNDYYLTITESRKRFTGEGYDRHKIFLYKEDFNKFIKGLNETVDYVKTELMPDFDFDAFSHEDDPSSGDEDGGNTTTYSSGASSAPTNAGEVSEGDSSSEEVDKW